MLKEKTFINEEGGAPLLMQNHFYLHKNDEIAWTKTRIWRKLLLNECDDIKEALTTKNSSKEDLNYGLKMIEKPDRLIVKDAERIFLTESKRQLIITILEALKSLFNDYQQTMAYITGILLLFFDPKTVFEMMFMLGRNPKYNMSGYWRHDAVQQEIDSYVLFNILNKINPKLYNHLQRNNVLCGWIALWFGGLSVQTMPIKHLIDFWTQIFKYGYIYLFKFILSLLQTLSPMLLSIDIDYKLMRILRGDRKSKFWRCCDIGNGNQSNMLTEDEMVSKFFVFVLNNTESIGKYCAMDKLDYQREREFVFNKYLSQRLLNASVDVTFKGFEIELGDETDDELKDCAQCDDGFADIFCNQCQIYLCDHCHNNPSGDHIITHSIKQLEFTENTVNVD